MEPPELSLYLHIPFCAGKCDYCDFYSIPADCSAAAQSSAVSPDRLINRYQDALLWETERRLTEAQAETGPFRVPTVYIGGGTPSVLGADGITRLLDGIHTLCGTPEEITVEANPESAGSAFLAACARRGVTRMSLGIQSFDETLLERVGRKDRAASGAPSGGAARGRSLDDILSEAAALFGDGLSLDLISGLPGQREAALLADVKRALSYKPGHISLYALTVEEGTPLARNAVTGLALPSGEDADALWLAGRDALLDAGYEQYEVSNFSRAPACRSLHNTRYWRMNNWLGIGPAASGTIINDRGTGRRRNYIPDVEQFCAAVERRALPPETIEELDRNTVVKETLLMGCRYCEGPDPALFTRRFGTPLETIIPKTLARWKTFSGEHTAPRADGGEPLPPDTDLARHSFNQTVMRFLNRFLRDAFAEIDSRGII